LFEIGSTKEGSPPQGLSEARQGKKVVFWSVVETAAGAPVEGGGVHRLMREDISPIEQNYPTNSRNLMVKLIQAGRKLMFWEYTIILVKYDKSGD
jgi:hypothetical protein